MKVEIITVGNEVVCGYTINTNASYLAKEVQALGMQPTYISTICDEQSIIKETVINAAKRAELILVTGGLGPTPDDLTKEAVCEALNLPIQVIPEQLEKIQKYFNEKGCKMPSNNEKQAAFPKEAIILNNDCGTAPGCLIESENTTIVLLPGPPRELQMMFSKYVVPLLKDKSTKAFGRLDVKCFGIGESELATRIKHLLGQNENITVATYVNNGEVIVRITAYANQEEEAKRLTENMGKKVHHCLEEFIIGYNEEELEENVVQLLLNQNLTISTVESCTGGLIAATLVRCGGVSTCFKEGIITYSNEAKMKYIGVNKETLAEVGAVSEETAREMAEGIRREPKVDIGLSSTGSAGPGGGTPKKPVGLVYIGIATKEGTDVFKLQLNGSRQEIREKTVKHILFQLYKKIK